MKNLLKIVGLFALFLNSWAAAEEELSSTIGSTTRRSVRQIESFLDRLATDKNNSRTYFISKTNATKSFEDAKRACNKLNLRMLSFETEEEQAFLLSVFSERENRIPRAFKPPYIGLTRTSNNTWQRIDGTNVKFPLKFLRGEPNNVFGNENCIEITEFNWISEPGLNDTPCDALQSFVCVKS